MKHHTKMNIVNGGLFVGMNVLAALSLWFSGDEAGHWISAMWLFYIKGALAMINNALLGLKTYLSQMKQEQPDVKTGLTEFITKP